MLMQFSRKVSWLSTGEGRDSYYPKGTELSYAEPVCLEVQKGDRVTFRYIKPHSCFRQPDGFSDRIGTVETIRGGALVIQGDDCKFKSFSGSKMFELCVV